MHPVYIGHSMNELYFKPNKMNEQNLIFDNIGMMRPFEIGRNMPRFFKLFDRPASFIIFTSYGRPALFMNFTRLLTAIDKLTPRLPCGYLSNARKIRSIPQVHGLTRTLQTLGYGTNEHRRSIYLLKPHSARKRLWKIWQNSEPSEFYDTSSGEIYSV